MAEHHKLDDHFVDGIFFAHPGCPWERGCNENINGLLRQYFPKGTDLRIYTLDDLRAVEHRLNTRPRKTLGWRTPTEIFHQLPSPQH